MPQNRFWVLLSKKFSGEASDAELQELHDLLQNNPDWYYSMQHIQDIWNLTPRDDHFGTQEAFQHHLDRMKKLGLDVSSLAGTSDQIIPIPRNKSKLKFLLAVPLVIGVIAIAFLYSPGMKTASTPIDTPSSEISTRKGSKTKMVLPDGSTVWLNAGSTLSYNKTFGEDAREVTLAGEAYFDVIKNEALPFVIHTKQLDIKVLGTAFNVKCYPGEKTTETSLVRGSLEVVIRNRPEKKFVLKPHEKLVVANEEGPAASVKDQQGGTARIPMATLEQLTHYPTDNSIVETSWIEDKLVFSDETFEEVAEKMERWYDTVINFKDDNLKKERLTGSFKNETIYQALEALRYSTNFNYTIHPNQIILTK